MASRNAPAVAEKAGLPDLPPMYDRPVHKVDQGDSAIPKVYVMADLSRMVENDVAAAGDVVIALSADDTDPKFLLGGPTETDSFRAYILSSERYVVKGKPGTDDWKMLDSNYSRDPGNPEDEDVSVGYRYALAIEGLAFPFASLLLIRTAGRAAFQKINHGIDMAYARNDPNPILVEFTRERTHGRRSGKPFWRLLAKIVQPDDVPEQSLEWVRPFVAKYREYSAGFHTEETKAAADVEQPGASF